MDEEIDTAGVLFDSQGDKLAGAETDVVADTVNDVANVDPAIVLYSKANVRTTSVIGDGDNDNEAEVDSAFESEGRLVESSEIMLEIDITAFAKGRLGLIELDKDAPVVITDGNAAIDILDEMDAIVSD